MRSSVKLNSEQELFPNAVEPEGKTESVPQTAGCETLSRASRNAARRVSKPGYPFEMTGHRYLKRVSVYPRGLSDSLGLVGSVEAGAGGGGLSVAGSCALGFFSNTCSAGSSSTKPVPALGPILPVSAATHWG